MLIGTDDTIVYIKDLPDWRSRRLIALAHLIGLHESSILKMIESVSDHEGWLTVVWKEEPTYQQREWVSDKWAEVGEEPGTTNHLFDGHDLDNPFAED